MLRVTGAVCIIAGCTGMGIFYRQRLHAAVRHLHYMQWIMELFISQVRYGKATLPECCRQVGEKAREPYGQALLSIHSEMEQHDGYNFHEKWQAKMGKVLQDIPLTAAEKNIFLGFSECSGLADNLMQVRAIEQCRDMLVSAVKSREDNLEKQGRLAAGLGIMSGLLLTVILL